jgi:hypothetical protein
MQWGGMYPISDEQARYLQTQGSMSRQYGAGEGYGGASDFDGCVYPPHAPALDARYAAWQEQAGYIVMHSSAKPTNAALSAARVIAYPHTLGDT